MTKVLATQFTTLEEAEDSFDLGINSYSGQIPTLSTASQQSTNTQLNTNPLLAHLSCLTLPQIIELTHKLVTSLPNPELLSLAQIITDKLDEPNVLTLFNHMFSLLSNEISISLLDKLFVKVAYTTPLTTKSDLNGFVQHSLTAMKNLKDNKQANALSKFARVLSVKRPDGRTLFPMDRMPWGLVLYQIEFFDSFHINQVS